jgi:uncharacterized protein (TIGR02246 family)
MPTPKPSAVHSKDATASVKSVVASLAESWNRHDMAAFAAAFAENADFVNVIGMHWQGRQEIEAKHTVTHRTIIALAHVSTELKGAESLRERVAPETRRSLLTCVLVKEADRWLITAAHNTDIVPVPFPVG